MSSKDITERITARSNTTHYKITYSRTKEQNM